jgi:hypothetical protein
VGEKNYKKKKLDLVKVDEIHLAQDKEKWRALVQNIISIRSYSPVPYIGITGLSPA